MAAAGLSTCWSAIPCRGFVRTMAMQTASKLGAQIEERLLARNETIEGFFSRESLNLATACREMSERFQHGGRLLAFGRGPYATDAQHVSVEFVHPVIVGKRALPALDLSIAFGQWLSVILRAEDIVMGFGPPEGDPEVQAALASAQSRKAMTFALPGPEGSYALRAITQDPFIHQEMVEIFYHTLWETVHVFLEHRQLGHRRQRLVARLRPAAIGLSSHSGDFASYGACQHHRSRQRCRHRGHLPASTDCPSSTRRCRDWNLHQWRITQRCNGSRRSPQARPADGRAARLRR